MSTFDFERLEVWQRAMQYAELVLDVADRMQTDRRHFRLIEQLESSATSIPMNIAEGKGLVRPKQYLNHLHYSRGSLYESITLVQLLHRREWASDEDYREIMALGMRILKMLNALIGSIRRRI